MSNPLTESMGLLATLRREVVERLATYEDILAPVSIEVIDGGKTDLFSTVAETLTKRTAGLCLVVTTPRLTPGDLHPGHLVATVSVQVYEHPIKNWSVKGARIAPEDAGEKVMTRLMFGATGAEGWSPSAAWTSLEFTGLRPILSSPEQVTFEVTFTTQTITRVVASS